MKSKRLVDYEIPYIVVIPKFIEHFKIDTTDEISDNTSVRRNCEIKKKHLDKLGMRRIGNQWLMIGEGPILDEDEMDAVAEQLTQQAGPQWSPFGSLMI